MVTIKRDRLEAFKHYLDRECVAYREPSAASQHQVLQVQTGAGWTPLYKSEKYPLHYRTSGRLIENLVRNFARND
jgi:predicted metal-dependent phosphoesterase TrpH